MASSTAESFDQDSNIAKNTDSGVSVNFLLFSGNLVEKAFEAAMAEVNDSRENEVTLLLLFWSLLCSHDCFLFAVFV